MRGLLNEGFLRAMVVRHDQRFVFGRVGGGLGLRFRRFGRGSGVRVSRCGRMGRRMRSWGRMGRGRAGGVRGRRAGWLGALHHDGDGLRLLGRGNAEFLTALRTVDLLAYDALIRRDVEVAFRTVERRVHTDR